MTAVRKTPTVANGGSDVGTTYTNAVNTEIVTLWAIAPQFLPTIGGSANAITAASDPAFVSTLTSYARGNMFWFIATADNTSNVTINIDGVGAVPINDMSDVGLTSGVIKNGRMHLIVCDGFQFRLFASTPPSNPPTPAPDIIVQEQAATSTTAGSFTAGSFVTRALNTVVRNVVGGASLASNKVTLPAGTYTVQWSAPAYIVGTHATRLFNVTDSATIETGTAEKSSTADTTQTKSTGLAVFTLSSSKDIRLEHQCTTTNGTNGLGIASGFGAHEVYSYVWIWKVA